MVRARPSRLYDGPTVKAVTWPLCERSKRWCWQMQTSSFAYCHSSRSPSVLPITAKVKQQNMLNAC